MTKIGKKAETSHAFTDDDDADDDDSDLFNFCSEIAAEEELLEPVHKALSLWESCFPRDNTGNKDVVIWARAVDWTVSIDYVEALVMIYKLTEVCTASFYNVFTAIIPALQLSVMHLCM